MIVITVNQPNTAALAKLKIMLKTFFSLIAWKVPTTDKIATKPKITINKFMNSTPFDNTMYYRKKYSFFIVNGNIAFVES